MPIISRMYNVFGRIQNKLDVNIFHTNVMGHFYDLTGEQGKAGHIFHLISIMSFVCTSSGKLAFKKVTEPTVGFVSGGHMCHKANQSKLLHEALCETEAHLT